MKPFDLSSSDLMRPLPTRLRVGRSAALSRDSKDPISYNSRQKNRNLTVVASSRKRSLRDLIRPKPKFGCPFYKRDPNTCNSTVDGHCFGESFSDISTLIGHLFGQHTDLYHCRKWKERFNSRCDLLSHSLENHLEDKFFLTRPRLPRGIAPATLAGLHKMRESQNPQTSEAEWQKIYQLLFPDDDRTFSPYVETSAHHSEHDSESIISSGPRGVATWMTTASTKAPKIGLELQRKLRHAADRYTRSSRGLVKKRGQDQQNKDGMEWAERDLKKETEQKQRDEKYKEPVEEDMGKSSMTHASPCCVPTYLTSLHEQETKSLDCGRHESQISDPQVLLDWYHEGHKTPPLRDDSPSRREPQSPVIFFPPAGDDFGAELSRLDFKEGSSEQSTELSEEEELQSSDFDDIDTNSRAYLSFDPFKRALFNKQSRQFWGVYNGLSVSDWFALWRMHTAKKRAMSECEKVPEATRTTSDTRRPSDCPSNSSSSTVPKRKKGDDEDETNDNRNPSKRSNRTLLQKEDLNPACPFHKYKPWKYNHGILRFRTCSTTPFDAIFRLKEHLRRVHPPPLHCTRCWQTFADQNSLVNHGQADIPCQRKPPEPVDGWTTEMDKKVTKRKDETEGERWERIYRELFGRTLTEVPSPYFVPYDPPAANEAGLETLLHQEVPRVVLKWLRERVSNMRPDVAQHCLFSISDSSDSSDPYHGFATMIGRAIDEAFTKYRSAAATTNNPETSLTPQSSSENPSISGNSTAQSATWESTHTVPLQSFRDQSSGFEPLPAVLPSESSGVTHQQNNSTQPTMFRNPFTRSHEHSPPPATELAPQASETASNPSLPNPPSQLQSAAEYVQHHDVTSAYDVSMDEYMFINFDFDGGFDDVAFSNLPSSFGGAPACS